MGTIFAFTNSDIIGLIIAIALVALTIAVCFYLLSKQDKKNSSLSALRYPETEFSIQFWIKSFIF